MAPRLQWSVELVTKEFVVPRVDFDLIDELFYQDDEIGEMRQAAFMIQCGLEEDPPEGPDVPPVPWGEMLLKQQHEEMMQNKAIASDAKVVTNGNLDYGNRKGDGNGDNNSHDKNCISNNGGSIIEDKYKEKQQAPNRSRSSDESDTLPIELATSIFIPNHKVTPKRTSRTSRRRKRNKHNGNKQKRRFIFSLRRSFSKIYLH